MSVKIMSLVWERAPYTAGSLLVFLALADWSNDEGVCWPSIAKIANKTRLERRSIQYIIRQLKEDDMIEIEEGRGRGHQHRYSIKVQNLRLLPNLTKDEINELNAQPIAPLPEIKGAIRDMEKAQSTTQKAQSTTQKVQPIAPDPLVDPLVDPSVDPEEVRAVKPRSPRTQPKFCDKAFLAELQADEAYLKLNVKHVHAKMVRWCKQHGKQATRNRLVNWLNSEDLPMEESNGTNQFKPETTSARNLRGNLDYLRSLQEDSGPADSESAPRLLSS